MNDSAYWARYYGVTVDRPSWETVRFAIERFRAEGPPEAPARLAIDLGCGAGRDARELLRAGWRVLAVDREPGAIEMVVNATPAELRPLLETRVDDLATVSLPPADLVNASLSLPFLPADAYWGAWRRALDAVRVGGRVAAMLFGDRDDSADDPAMTCPPPQAIRDSLGAFEIEHWVDLEEDTTTALGEPHHFHRVDLVAQRVR